ncbi:MAG TPA: LamG domain-containing protein [Labilithrix sp.]
MRRVVLASALSLALAACSLLVSTDDLTGGPTSDAGSPADAGRDAPVDAPHPPPPPPPPPVSVDGGSSPYRDAVLADAPLSYWRFGETSGTTAKDEMGAHDGTYAGEFTLGAQGALMNESSTAVTLANGAVDMGDVYGFEGRAPFTVEAWVKPALLDSSYRNVYTKLTAGYPRTGHFLWAQSGALAFERNLDWVYMDGGSQETVGVANGVPESVWTHLVATYDGMTQTIFVNGVAADDGPSTASLTATGTHLLVGSADETGGVWVGEIDELAIYGKALAAERVAAHFAASGR